MRVLRATVEPVTLQVFGNVEPVDYQVAWDQQRAWHAQVVDGTMSDLLWLLEHPPVYTAGRRTEPFDRPVDGTPVIDVDRGGKITWHGPGQLVGYPIVRLPDPIDVVARIAPRALLLIAPQGDQLISWHQSEKLFAAAGEPKELFIVPDAGHAEAYALAPEAYRSRVLDFLERHLG